MKKNSDRIAAVLAVIIGAMAIFAGGQVLLGRDPGYYVIGWLPIYNFIVGVISVFVTAVLIWKHSPYAIPAAVATLSLNTLVMLTILIGCGDVVAKDSIVAMTIRIVVWMIIVGLLVYASRRTTAAVV
jgi:hypothetical protein